MRSRKGRCVRLDLTSLFDELFLNITSIHNRASGLYWRASYKEHWVMYLTYLWSYHDIPITVHKAGAIIIPLRKIRKVSLRESQVSVQENVQYLGKAWTSRRPAWLPRPEGTSDGSLSSMSELLQSKRGHSHPLGAEVSPPTGSRTHQTVPNNN